MLMIRRSQTSSAATTAAYRPYEPDQFPVERPVRFTSVERTESSFRVRSGDRHWDAKVVVSATGTWSNPYIPRYPDAELFAGRQLHSAYYVEAQLLAGKKVLVVGGGNWWTG